jgi:hypothetical protein
VLRALSRPSQINRDLCSSMALTVILPTYQTTNFAQIGVDNLQTVSCATAPDQSFCSGRDQLSRVSFPILSRVCG